uniref:Uncharacterized protein n=1 Tax=Schizaphis graminum TaxID=13262 RepID=A0A2S2NUH1_SCHGA
MLVIDGKQNAHTHTRATYNKGLLYTHTRLLMSSHGGHGNNNYKPAADRPLTRAIYNSEERGGAKTSRFSQDRPVAITSCPSPSPQPLETKKPVRVLLTRGPSHAQKLFT